MQETIFGNIDSFGIKYKSGYKSKAGNYYFARLHFILGGQIIGDPNEECFLLSWIHSVEKIRDRILNHSERLKNCEFENRPDDEIFELIWKANGINNPKYSKLPMLNESVWSFCHVSVDETVDAWLISMIEDNGKIKFLWKGWREPCPIERIGKLYSVKVEKQFVVETIENCLFKIKEEYLYYPEK